MGRSPTPSRPITILASLAATAVNLNGATTQASGGNAANLSLIGLTQTGPEFLIMVAGAVFAAATVRLRPQ